MPENIDGSPSSSSYSGNSIIEASQNYRRVHERLQSAITLPPASVSSQYHQRQPRPMISSSHSSSSHSSSPSYEGESLIEASKRRAPDGTMNPGVTSPEDVSLSEDLKGGKSRNHYEDHNHDPYSRQLTSEDEPMLPNVRQSTRDRRTQQPETSSSEDDMDVYQPPERAAVANHSVEQTTERPPPFHMIGESFSNIPGYRVTNNIRSISHGSQSLANGSS